MLPVAVPTVLPRSRTDARTEHASSHEKRTRSTPRFSAPALTCSAGAVLSVPGPGLGCGVCAVASTTTTLVDDCAPRIAFALSPLSVIVMLPVVGTVMFSW